MMSRKSLSWPIRSRNLPVRGGVDFFVAIRLHRCSNRIIGGVRLVLPRYLDFGERRRLLSYVWRPSLKVVESSGADCG